MTALSERARVKPSSKLEISSIQSSAVRPGTCALRLSDRPSSGSQARHSSLLTAQASGYAYLL